MFVLTSSPVIMQLPYLGSGVICTHFCAFDPQLSVLIILQKKVPQIKTATAPRYNRVTKGLISVFIRGRQAVKIKNDMTSKCFHDGRIIQLNQRHGNRSCHRVD